MCKSGKSIKTENVLVVAYGLEGMVWIQGVGQGYNILSEVMRRFKNWWWSYTSVYILKSTQLYSLHEW